VDSNPGGGVSSFKRINHWQSSTTLEADSFRNAQALKDFDLICSR